MAILSKGLSIVLVLAACMGCHETPTVGHRTSDAELLPDMVGMSWPDCNCLPDIHVPDASGLSDAADAGMEEYDAMPAVGSTPTPLDVGGAIVQDASVNEGSDALSDPEEPFVEFCPTMRTVELCRFGNTSLALVERSGLDVELTARHYSDETMTPNEQNAWVFGFACEGVFAPDTVTQAFELIDQDGLRVYRITDEQRTVAFTWFRFYMGDTEIGYIYEEGTSKVAALVSDGDILRCQVPAAP